MKLIKTFGSGILVKEYKPKTQANIFLFEADPFELDDEMQQTLCMTTAGEVVLVGRGYRTENGEIIPLEVKSVIK